ncbi:hypothetical protein [Bradyrhizobium sp.]|uniref:hypothetical protein n=1 Tax=Bradyrhizobium sp. TaxID=376 RepID=UPI003C6F08E4
MRNLFAAVVFVGCISIFGAANAADGCGPGCHSVSGGACVIDGWGSSTARNECPAGAQPRPPCGTGYVWQRRLHACFER